MIIKVYFFLILAIGTIFGQSKFKLDGGLTVSHFQQQVKVKAGGPRGDRLINEFQFGGLVQPLYNINKYFSLGGFVRYDIGLREAGAFTGFDSDDKAVTNPKLGGSYQEIWLGLLAQANWKFLSLDLGYAAFGWRDDEGRSDILNDKGSSSGGFGTSAAVAYLLALGGRVPIISNLDLLLKLEYRVRYYDKRDGEALQGEMEHGTMSLSPVIGVTWSL